MLCQLDDYLVSMANDDHGRRLQSSIIEEEHATSGGNDDAELIKFLTMTVLTDIKRRAPNNLTHYDSRFLQQLRFLPSLLDLFGSSDVDTVRLLHHLRDLPCTSTTDVFVQFVLNVAGADHALLLEYLISDETINVRGVPDGGFLGVFIDWLKAVDAAACRQLEEV